MRGISNIRFSLILFLLSGTLLWIFISPAALNSVNDFSRRILYSNLTSDNFYSDADIFNGTALISSGKSIKYCQRLKVPFVISLDILKEAFGTGSRSNNTSFKVEFGSCGEETYYFSYNEVVPELTGIFKMSGNRIEQILNAGNSIDLDQYRAPKGAANRTLKIQIQCFPNRLILIIEDHRYTLEFSEAFDYNYFKLESLPFFFVTKVDNIRVSQSDPTTRETVTHAADFEAFPASLQLHNILKAEPDSRSVLFVGFLILIIAGFGLDLVIHRLHPLFTLTASGLVFLTLPGRILILFFLRDLLNLPYTSLFVYLPVSILLHFIFLVNSGFTSRTVIIKPSSRFSLFLGGLSFYGFIFYAEASYSSGLQAVPATAIFVMLFITVVLYFMATLLLKSLSPGLFPAALLQYFIWYAPGISLPEEMRFAYLLISIIPWTVGFSLSAVKRDALSRHLSMPILACTLIYAAGSFEILMRSVPYLNRSFDIKSVARAYMNNEGVRNRFYNVETGEKVSMPLRTGRVSRFLGDNLVKLAGRTHSLDHPEGVFRIVCLGSSSTEGHSTSDYTKFSYPPLLEEELNRESDKEIEVINGGIGGASFFLLLKFFENTVLDLKPDLLIVYFGANGDIDGGSFSQKLENKLLYDPDIRTDEELWSAMQLKWPYPIVSKSFRTLSRSRCFLCIVTVVKDARNYLPGRINNPLPNVPGGSKRHNGIKGIRDVPGIQNFLTVSPEKLVKLCTENQIRVLLLPEVIVDDIKTGTCSLYYHDIFRDLSSLHPDSGIHFASLLDSFTSKDIPAMFIDDIHLTDHGNLFLAKQIARILKSKNLIP